MTYSVKEYCIGYANLVLDGHVIACQKEKWACMRFLRDIEREGTEEFPYYFDDDAAMHFIEWMTLFKHTKGGLQGEYIEPAPIQIFIFGNVYGWYQVRKDGKRKRRFTRVYWQVGRKNSKSQSLSCVASYEAMAYGVSGSEVYLGATKKDQASIVFREVEAQLRACDFLEGKYKIAYGKIMHPKSGSYIVALSKDAGKTGDGFNPQCAIIDEYHASQTSEILDVLTSGQGARLNPLTVIITTAGFNLNHPCYRVEYDLVSKILNPDKPENVENYFCMVNELDAGDSYDDERNWHKANPILCSYEDGIESVRKEYELAKLAPEKRRNFLTKNMNVWVQMTENGYVDLSKWKRIDIEMPDLTGRPCYIGVDLSKKHDLTSVGFVFPLQDGYFAVKQHSFLPKERLAEKLQTDNVPYDLWVQQGYITLTEGEVIDYRFVMKYIIQQLELNQWKGTELCYDPYSADQFAQEMATEGFVPIEIRQGHRTLSEPTKHFRESILQQKIIHDHDPVLTWGVGNAVVRYDPNENIMLDKHKSANKIDMLAAIINAHVRAMNDHLAAPDMSSHFTSGWSF